jgi:hypothetical protein
MTGTGKDGTIGSLPGGNGRAIMQNKANFQRVKKETSVYGAMGYERKWRIAAL